MSYHTFSSREWFILRKLTTFKAISHSFRHMMIHFSRANNFTCHITPLQAYKFIITRELTPFWLQLFEYISELFRVRELTARYRRRRFIVIYKKNNIIYNILKNYVVSTRSKHFNTKHNIVYILFIYGIFQACIIKTHIHQ